MIKAASLPLFFSIAATVMCFWPAISSAQDFLYDFQTEQPNLDDFEFGQEQEDEKKFVNQYSDRYQVQGNAIEVNRGLIPQAEFMTRFVRTAGAKPNEAVLRLTSPVMINGCVNLQQPQVTIHQNGRMMMVLIGEAGMALTSSVRYAHFECDQSGQVAQADIVLDRDLLIEDRVMSILFQAGPFTDYFDVAVSQESLALNPRSTNAFKPFFRPGAPEPLVYHFHPDTLVILETGGALKSTDLAQKIKTLAASNGLVPLDMSGFQRTETNGPNGSKHYFTDPARRYVDNITFGERRFFGNIQLSQTLSGPQGPFMHAHDVDVYIKRPGELD